MAKQPESDKFELYVIAFCFTLIAAVMLWGGLR